MAFEHIEEIMKHAIATSVWHPADVTIEPDTELTQWQVHKVTTDDGLSTVHFMGSTGGRYGEGRVCSAILAYDTKTKKGVTKSGRVYELIGDPGYSKDAMYVFNIWCNRFPETTVFEDITDQYAGLV